MGDSGLLQRRLRDRTKPFARDVIRLLGDVASIQASRVIGNQLLRSITSVAANYRASGRARSRRDFAARMGVVLEEADETLFWLELLADTGIVEAKRLSPFLAEVNELVLIFSASQATATRRRKAATSSQNPG